MNKGYVLVVIFVLCVVSLIPLAYSGSSATGSITYDVNKTGKAWNKTTESETIDLTGYDDWNIYVNITGYNNLTWSTECDTRTQTDRHYECAVYQEYSCDTRNCDSCTTCSYSPSCSSCSCTTPYTGGGVSLWENTYSCQGSWSGSGGDSYTLPSNVDGGWSFAPSCSVSTQSCTCDPAGSSMHYEVGTIFNAGGSEIGNAYIYTDADGVTTCSGCTPVSSCTDIVYSWSKSETCGFTSYADPGETIYCGGNYPFRYFYSDSTCGSVCCSSPTSHSCSADWDYDQTLTESSDCPGGCGSDTQTSCSSSCAACDDCDYTPSPSGTPPTCPSDCPSPSSDSCGCDSYTSWSSTDCNSGSKCGNDCQDYTDCDTGSCVCNQVPQTQNTGSTECGAYTGCSCDTGSCSCYVDSWSSWTAQECGNEKNMGCTGACASSGSCDTGDKTECDSSSCINVEHDDYPDYPQVNVSDTVVYEGGTEFKGEKMIDISGDLVAGSNTIKIYGGDDGDYVSYEIWGEKEDTRPIKIENITDFVQDDTESHNFSKQYGNRSYNITNNFTATLKNIEWSADCPYGTCVNGNETHVNGTLDSLNSGESKIDYAVFYGDWITGETESSYNKYADTDYDQTEDSQRIHNRTQLDATNSKSFTFSGVDISGICSQTTSSDVPAGTNTITTDCNRPTFLGDWITQSLSSHYEDPVDSHTLSTQYLRRNKTLTENGGYSWTAVDTFAPSLDGICSDCNTRENDLPALGSAKETYNSHGDWISEMEGTYRKEQNVSRNSDVDRQYIWNQTNLSATNPEPFSFDSVDLTSYCGIVTSADIPSGTNEITTSCNNISYIGDWITESRSPTEQGKAVEDSYVTFNFGENWTLSSSSPVGFKNINQTYTLPDSLIKVVNASINGTEYYNDRNTNLVNISGNKVYVNWNYTMGVGETLDPTVYYLDTAVRVRQYGDPTQDPDGIYNPYKADYNKTIPFSWDVDIKNPSSDNIYHNVTVNASITKDAIPGLVSITPPDGYSYHNLSVNVSTANVEWVMDEIENSTDLVDWGLDWDVTAINKNISIRKEMVGERKAWRKFINITNNKTDITDVLFYSDAPNKTFDKEVFSISLYLNGTEVTTDSKYGPPERISRDEDDATDYIKWSVPEVSSLQRWEIRGDLGQPIIVFEEPVITNKPVMEGKNIQWRVGYKFWNNNTNPMDYSYQARVPLNAFETYIKTDSNWKFKQVSYGIEGAYIPILFDSGNLGELKKKSNRTVYIRYKTRPITITSETLPPERYFVGENAEITKNITVINHATESIEDVQKRVPIAYGENVTIYHGNGTLKNETSLVTEEYNLKVNEIDAKETKKYRITYEIPTAEITETKALTSDRGNPMRYYKVSSTARKPLDPLYLKVEDLDCNQVVNATNFKTGEKYEVECDSNFNAMINLGKIAVNQGKEALVEYKNKEKVVKPDPWTTLGFTYASIGVIGGIVSAIAIAKFYLLGGEESG